MKNNTAARSNMDKVNQVYASPRRSPLRNLDQLPLVNRTLVDYEKYNHFIGQSMVKNCISLQATRGCPFKCAFCHKIWPKTHSLRSAENLYEEIKLYYHMGIRRFVFIDDIFNLDRQNTVHFFKMIIKSGMRVQLFYPNGLRCDILNKDYIDLMVEAGTTDISFALDTASPRLQKLIGKNLDIERFRENIQYVCQTYPHVILEFQVIYGFPTETEAEALMSLDFLKSIKWLDFPYIHILKIYHGTDMEKLALEKGISPQAIARSQEMTYDELPWGEAETHLPFNRDFTYRFQAEFLHGYVLLKERLQSVLPYHMRMLSETDLVQKYNSYLPFDIDSLDDLLHHLGLTRQELGQEHCQEESTYHVPELNRKIAAHFPADEPGENALKVLLLDLTLFFSQGRKLLYNVVEPPLGLMYLMSYLKQQKGRDIQGTIAKSRIDFDSYEELLHLLDEFKPDVVGLRSLNIFKHFFHEAIEVIRGWGKHLPLIAGGPYATSAWQTILDDPHIDIVVLGEGEITFCQLIEAIMENNGNLPAMEVLKEIPGIAFVPSRIAARTAADKTTSSAFNLEKLKEERLTHFNVNLEDE
jgi:radical SAM superfamily enzyme YgiQ (UPF0313 family)